MAPPVTPSPRRFLQSSKPRAQPRASQLSLPVYAHVTPSSYSRQFAPTPHFSTHSNKIIVEDVESPTSSPLATRTRQTILKPLEESIDDDNPVNAEDQSIVPEPLDIDFDLPPRKRRRLTPSPPPIGELIVLSSSPPLLLERSPSISPSPALAHEATDRDAESTKSRNAQSAAPRFRLPPLIKDYASKGSSTENPTAFSTHISTSKQNFIFPAQANPVDLESLEPKEFSPQKRGDKRYVPGGLANLVRDWIVGLSSEALPMTSSSVPKPRARSNPEHVALIVVKAAHYEQESGLLTVRAADFHDQDVGVVDYTKRDWMLVGQDGYGHTERAILSIGDLVGIVAPVWEVDIQGRKWGVAVNWEIRNHS